MTYTAWFDEIRKDDIALAGGQGASLGELSHAGFPCRPASSSPPGRTTHSSSQTTSERRSSGAPRQPGRRTRAFEEVAEDPRAFSRRQGSEEMAHEIRAAEEMSEDGETPVAVRSSATAEDLPGASFAGQQDTYLNVRGAEALLEAVKNCWTSLWTARAMAYRARQGIDPATVSLAVVVQRMVESESAGVMFTANPANGRRNEVAISAAWGLGESVVSGSVTPDSIVVEKESGRVISREISNKEV